tara:strand:+ start:275 stop:457 length:183 start_codon:yes stop_codon:yes gene_type:complete
MRNIRNVVLENNAAQVYSWFVAIKGVVNGVIMRCFQLLNEINSHFFCFSSPSAATLSGED